MAEASPGSSPPASVGISVGHCPSHCSDPWAAAICLASVVTHVPSRRRDYHFTDIPSPSVLKHLLEGEGGAAE